ncbi:MAG: hypothetical protein OXB86_03405 [Bdellovibrionales bacterium]|nr:hypothetical protein [Bdellovibrionales bacterium]
MKIRFLLLMSSVIMTGCYFGGGFTNIAPSVGSKTSAPDEDFMYLDLNDNYYDNLGVEPPLYEMNTTEGADKSARRDSRSNCEILYDEEEPAGPEIICIFDYMEEEFLTYDLSFVVNVPKGMCSHLFIDPSWHYNRPMGRGPLVIKHVKTTDDEGNESDTYCDEQQNKCVDEESKITEDLCPYTHNRGKDKISCCLGTYDIDSETSSSTNNSWGGEAKNCLGGPGRTSWDSYDRDGFPITSVREYILEDGLRLTFEINNLIDVAEGGCYNTPIDNYMERFDKPVEDLMESSLDLPTFIDQKNDLLPGNPFYTFECRDSAGDIPHRINLMIREWNTYEEFYAFYDSGGSDDNADPDIKGEEGEDCEYEPRLQLRSDCALVSDGCTTCCNDYWDLEDTLELRDYPEAHYVQ